MPLIACTICCCPCSGLNRVLLGDVAANAAAAAATELCDVAMGEKETVEDVEVLEVELVELVESAESAVVLLLLLVESLFLLPSRIVVSCCLDSPALRPNVFPLLRRLNGEDAEEAAAEEEDPLPLLLPPLLLLPPFLLSFIFFKIRLMLSPCRTSGLFSSNLIFLCRSFSPNFIISNLLRRLPYLSLPGPWGLPGP